MADALFYLATIVLLFSWWNWSRSAMQKPSPVIWFMVGFAVLLLVIREAFISNEPNIRADLVIAIAMITVSVVLYFARFVQSKVHRENNR